MWLDWSRRAHRGLRTWILVLVTKEPMNGAEIMDLMETGSKGWWRPSPGSVYPMLKQLMDEGLVTKRAEDGRYEITAQGKVEAEWPLRLRGSGPRTVEGALGEISSYVSLLEDLAESKDPKIGETASEIRELSSRLARIGGTK